MLISAAICTCNRYESLGLSVASLAAQTLDPAAFEIVVIDNSPNPDESARRSTAYRDISNLRWLHEPRRGVAHARNAAAAVARAPVLAFLDDDATAQPEWLDALLAAIGRSDEGVHAWGGPVRPHWLSPRPDWLADTMLPYLSVLDRGETPRLLEPAEWIVGTNSAFRVAPLRAAGGFNVSLGRIGQVLLSSEETELTGRLRAAGGAVSWVPDMVVYHRIDPARLDRAWFRSRVAWQAVSDCIAHAERSVAGRAASSDEVARYLACRHDVPALQALSDAPDGPVMSEWQTAAVYHLVLSLLGGFPAP
jgi:glycosyltransferase involved in cell wall biosynthesis